MFEAWAFIVREPCRALGFGIGISEEVRIYFDLVEVTVAEPCFYCTCPAERSPSANPPVSIKRDIRIESVSINHRRVTESERAWELYVDMLRSALLLHRAVCTNGCKEKLLGDIRVLGKRWIIGPAG